MSEETGQYSIGSSLYREKLWPERSVEEKLEALRAELSIALGQTKALQDRMSLLSMHEHGTHGLLAPIPPAGLLSPSTRTPLSLRDKE